MSDVKDYRAQFLKDPFQLLIDIKGLKNGLYKIEGIASEESWYQVCKRIGVPCYGEGQASFDMEKLGDVLRLTGVVNILMSRQCNRTLEYFDLKENIQFEEEFSISEAELDEDEAFNDGQFDVGNYLIQQVVLGMEPYPVHPSTLSQNDGGFDLKDGFDEQINKEKEKKNPFSVLKHLKSDE